MLNIVNIVKCDDKRDKFCYKIPVEDNSNI